MTRRDDSSAAETGEPWHSAIDTVLDRVILLRPKAACEGETERERERDSVSRTCLEACRKILRQAKTRGYHPSDRVMEQARRTAATRGGTWHLSLDFCRDSANESPAR